MTRFLPVFSSCDKRASQFPPAANLSIDKGDLECVAPRRSKSIDDAKFDGEHAFPLGWALLIIDQQGSPGKDRLTFNCPDMEMTCPHVLSRFSPPPLEEVNYQAIIHAGKLLVKLSDGP